MKPLFLAFFSTFSQFFFGQTPNEAPSVFEYFVRENISNITLETQVEKLLLNKSDNKTWRPATMVYKDTKQMTRAVEVEIRPKGHARRKICDMPPLKIRFGTEFLKSEGLDTSVRVLESVLTCKNESPYEQYVLREYASYRLYNILTDKSLRAHLLQLDLREKRARTTSSTGYAFFIEPEEVIAKRLKGRKREPRILSPNGIQPVSLDQLALFELMIGNTDWAISNRHNINTLLLPGDSLLTAVPYDFDYAGLVNTDYAVPGKGVNIPTVRTRYFKGPCRDAATWEATIKVFEAKKSEMLAFCTDFQAFEKSSRKHVIDYIEDFFELLADPNKRKSKILEHCGEEYLK